MLNAIETALAVWTTFARRAGWLILIGFAALTAFAGLYAARSLKVNTDTSAMLDEALPFQRRAAELRTAFPQVKDDVVIVVEAATLDEADAFASALAGRLRARTDHFTSVFAPASDPFFLENGLLYLDEGELDARLTQLTKAAGLIETLVAEPTAGVLFSQLAENDELAEKADISPETLHEIYAELSVVIRSALAGEKRPFSWMGALDTSEDPPSARHLRLVYAAPVLDYERLQPAKPALAALGDEIALLKSDFPGAVNVVATGDPALRAEELTAVTQGIGMSFILSLAAVSALLLIAYRSLYLSLLTLASLVVSLVLTAAFAAATVGELNLVSVAFTVLLVGLGLDFAIHFLLHVQERRSEGAVMADAIRGAVHDVGPAMALAAPTTALAFLAFVPTAFDGIAQLGVIAGAGVIIAFFVAMTLLPAALGSLPAPAVTRRAGGVRGAFRALDRISIPIAALTVGLGVAAAFLLPQARFDADPMSLRDPSSASVRGFNLLFEDENTTPYRLTRLVGDAAAAEKTAAAVKELETVRGVRSLLNFAPKDQDVKLELIDIASGALAFAFDAPEADGDGPGAIEGATRLRDRLREPVSPGDASAPERRALAEALDAALARAAEESGDQTQAFAAIETSLFAFWPHLVDRLEKQLNADVVELDDLPAALVDRYRSVGGLWRVDILPSEDVRDPTELRRFVRSVETVIPDLAGGASQTLSAGDAIAGAMMQATLIAFAVISAFLLLLVRRAGVVALMLAPLALAAVLTAATGVLIDLPFNYANVIVLPLLIGVGVDSGIHLVMRQRHQTQGGKVSDTSTPRAVLFSALTTVASFGSLMLSAHRGTASMGALLSIAIGFTLLCTLVVLPAAFRLGAARDVKSA